MSEKDILKEYGNVLLDPAYIIDDPPPIISVSPKIDIALGGGVPEGSLFILTGPEKVGKDQPLNATVYTPSGPKKMGDLTPGSLVCSPTHNRPAKVLQIFPQGEQDVYQVYFSDGTTAECGLNHLWEVYKDGYWAGKKVVPLKEILQDTLTRKNGDYLHYKYSIDIHPCEFDSRDTLLCPYLMGALLGDGGLRRSIHITNTDQEVLDRIYKVLEPEYYLKSTQDPITFRITNGPGKDEKGSNNFYIDCLKEYNLHGLNSKNKFIPDDYKYNSTKKRIALVQGLMDTDGTVDKNGRVSFTSASYQLAYDLAQVVRSLGYKVKIKSRYTKCNGKKFKSFRVYISGINLKRLFSLTRKVNRCKERLSQFRKSIHKIEKIGREPTQCIKLDTEDGLYFTDSYNITHNTVTALQFCKNAQQIKLESGDDRKVYYANVEGRIKKRDLEGIKDLNLDKDHFSIIGSTKGHILSGESYLGILDKVIHNEPHSVCVIDSFSALASEAELVSDITDIQVAAMNRSLSKFTRKFANVLPINRVTLVGITHLMANIKKFGAGKSKIEKSGNALKYAQDVKLWASHKKPIMQGETQIGQEVFWAVENSAIGPPGQKVSSMIKYGHGIWNEMEIISLAKDFGVIEGKSWLTFPNGEKYQGAANAAKYLEETPEAYADIKQQIFEMIGL